MKVKVISRNPDDYQRETKADLHKLVRNYNSERDAFQAQTEYVRALNATKLERVFAKPFVASLDGHNDGVSILSKHPFRSSTIFSGARDGQIKVWNLPRRECISTIQTHRGLVNGLSVDNVDGEQMVTVGSDSQLKMWKVPVTGKEANLDEPMHSIPLNEVAHSISHVANSTDFVTSGDTVNVWKPWRDSPIRTYNLGVNTIHCVRANPIEEAVMVGVTTDRSIFLLDTRQKSPLKKVTMKLRPNMVIWNPMEAFVFAVANDDYNAYSFDMRNLVNPRRIHYGHTMAVVDIDYSPTGRELCTGSFDRSVRIYGVDSATSREVYHTKRMQQVLSVLWSADSKFVLSGSNEMNVRVWKAHAAEKLGPMTKREESALQYSEKLREQFKEHPEIRRIQRHRHVPGSIYNQTKELRTIREAKEKKAERRIKYNKEAVPERDTHMVATKEEE
ncbi:unnamed protein product, partial [Mesorhabditis belari]|uniref:DDB1- and CUL4-associated factor 13 n=1 Tax=Mesorhabditis belari TaxID=2138241 RepID=A0AAF3J7Q3_9BILA